MEAILAEWEIYAKTRVPSAATMSVLELRDHAEEMLLAISMDMEHHQTESERTIKSKGLAVRKNGVDVAAAIHGAIRHGSGFTLPQLTSEFRALRASVLLLWSSHPGAMNDSGLEDITRFNEGLDQALAESVESYSAKISESRDIFLAVLGHDLRSPLASISNCVHILSSDTTGKFRDQSARTAKNSVKAMSAMITDLLEYTRTRLGKGIPVVAEKGSFDTVCRDVLFEMQSAYPLHNFLYDAEGHLAGEFDAPRIRQVLTNLLTNAAHHGDSTLPIHLSVQDLGHDVCLTVRNHGAPIPPNKLQVIFNPLVQVTTGSHEPGMRPSSSLGLGLFIAREIIMGHRGDITATSTDNATAFVIHLPKNQVA